MDPRLHGASWRKASRSGQSGGECVEIALCADADGVRDSKNATGPALVFPKGRLTAFLARAGAGRLDG
ncbi:DUF397 domain-containing protein [Umezawaea tangerina]|uniref:Uncharacterized protein DUF397 n=1 Tax=Umezawaea tangerina TaxID=84725 RepID=A0A2T0TCS3_9PSEU|nr:DUF397 domain-containing protein [Umezawaea tangerina]PRY43451.1 uncharacterized protein DUF397 [Umezawaea tangerina]